MRRRIGLEQIKEPRHESRGMHFLETLFQDVRYALRVLRKSPGFSAVAILTLTLGIGANSAVFGLARSALFHTLPFREPQRLVHVWTTDATGELHTPTPAEYLAVRKNSKAFEQVSGAGWSDFVYENGQSASETLNAFLVTPNWIPTLGIQPFLGRNFVDAEQVRGRDAVVILSFDCWRNRFHSDAHIAGKQITLNRRPATIIGVLPQSLGPYYQDVDVFAPLVLDSYVETGSVRSGIVRVQIVARLAAGATLEQARTEAEVVAQQSKRSSNSTDRSGHLVVEDFAEMFRHPGPTRQNAQRGMWMTAVAAALVLLVACANVASLLLARGVKRRREVALRAALGCSRPRMIRQLLTESTLLFACGAVLALIVVKWSNEIITTAAAGLVPGSYLQLDAPVFLATLGVAFLTALVFGMFPARRAARIEINDTLKEAASTAAAGLQSRRPRNFMVVFQIALGMMLLVGFGLLLRSLRNVETAPIGYDPRNVLTATLKLPPTLYTEPAARARLLREAIERARLSPAVESVGATQSLPMYGAESASFKIESALPGVTPFETELYFVTASPDYFSTLKVPLLAGRAFRDTDTFTSNPVAIVNETFAKQFFPRANPVGQHLALADAHTWTEIVGVVADFSQRNPEEDSRPLAYFPILQRLPGQWSMAMRLRTAADDASVARQLADSLRQIDPQLYWQFGSMRQQILESESLTLRRPVLVLSASFAVLALILALVGVFGVMSYSVSERTREIGIRVALGAVRGEIANLVLRETLAVTAAGLLLGAIGAYVIAQFLPTSGIGWSGSGIFLYRVSRTDPVTYLGAAFLLTTVAVAASWLPARRATRVDPLVALRHE